MAEATVRLSRGDGTPWGFRLAGGQDFGYPVCIQRVNPGSLAEQGGVRTGDQVLRISGRSAEHMSHQDAQNAILNSGNYLDLTLARGGSVTWAPSVQAVGGDIAPGSRGPVTRTSLAANKQQQTPIGSSHNTSAKPFSSQIVNKQYNCPAALYSMENIRDALEKQSEVLTGGAKGINFMKEDKPLNTDSAVYRMVHEEDKAPRRVPTHARIAAPAISNPIVSSGVDSSPLGSTGLRHVEAPTSLPASAQQPSPNVSAGGPNVCTECGKLIVGVFCRIKDRNMHAECFRCATCGNSLKNQGYFLVGGKLYCELHARNASVMLKEPLFQTSPQSITTPGPVSPGLPFSSAHAPSTPKPFSTSAPSRNSGCYESTTPVGSVSPSPYLCPSTPAFAPAAPSTARGFTWPPQDSDCQLVSNATRSAPMYRPPPESQHSSSSYNKRPAEASYNSSAPRWPPQQTFQQSMTTSTTTTTSAASPSRKPSSSLNAAAGGGAGLRRGRGILRPASGRAPDCATCATPIRGAFVSTGDKAWCPSHFLCANGTCRRDLMDGGFVEDNNLLYCEGCSTNYIAPFCSKCHQKIKGDCLNAIDRTWHYQCFTCTHCRKPFGNKSFYLEDGQPYCEKDWKELFTSKCFGCGFPIEAGDRWVETLSNNYHSTCFKCTVCHNPLEGQSFYAKDGKPYCRLHAR